MGGVCVIFVTLQLQIKLKDFVVLLHLISSELAPNVGSSGNHTDFSFLKFNQQAQCLTV